MTKPPYMKHMLQAICACGHLVAVEGLAVRNPLFGILGMQRRILWKGSRHRLSL